MIARARPTRFFMPPLRLTGIFFSCPSSSITSSISAIFCAITPLIALARFAQRKRDIFLDRHRVEERAALKQDADLAPDGGKLALAQSDDALTIDPDFALVRLHQSDQILQQDALAAAAAADDDERLASRNAQIDAAQNFLCDRSRFSSPRTAIIGRRVESRC